MGASFRMADTIFEIVAIVAVCIVILVCFLVLAVGTVRRLRRNRYSVGDFSLLVVVTGLGMGLTAKFLPGNWPLAGIMPSSAAAGLFVFWGGSWGIHAANRLDRESGARRALIILGGACYLPACLGAPAGLIVLGYAVAGELPPELAGQRLVVALVGVTAALLCGVLIRAMNRLVRRAGTDDPHPEEPPERAEEPEA